MIGDLFGPASLGGIFIGPFPYLVPGGVVGAAPGANVGRQKMTENGNPIPHDRLWVDYSHFNNTPVYYGGVDVNRVVVGAESTFLDGNASLEVRMPFASTLETYIEDPGPYSDSTARTGNLTMFLKGLLWDTDTWAVSSGVGWTLPTAEDVVIYDDTIPAQVLEVHNRSVHILPFIAGVYTPNDNWFLNWIVQFDIDSNGNVVYLTDGFLQERRRARDADYLFVDLSLGYWLYRERSCTENVIKGVAAICELHYNQAISRPDQLVGAFFVADPIDRLSTTNATVGLTTLLGESSALTCAYVAPLGGDEQFDGEFRLILDYRFGGGSDTLTRPARY
ncbi:MAG: hypothetical protein KDA75_03305 [Planctomycetaceae bacterium]|nr:hypothetical protein [Planctomycetaceae bacterium]